MKVLMVGAGVAGLSLAALLKQRRKQRIETIQNNSHGLGKMMFINSPLKAQIRNYISKMVSVKTLMKGFDEPV